MAVRIHKDGKESGGLKKFISNGISGAVGGAAKGAVESAIKGIMKGNPNIAGEAIKGAMKGAVTGAATKIISGNKSNESKNSGRSPNYNSTSVTGAISTTYVPPAPTAPSVRNTTSERLAENVAAQTPNDTAAKIHTSDQKNNSHKGLILLVFVVAALFFVPNHDSNPSTAENLSGKNIAQSVTENNNAKIIPPATDSKQTDNSQANLSVTVEKDDVEETKIPETDSTEEANLSATVEEDDVEEIEVLETDSTKEVNLSTTVEEDDVEEIEVPETDSTEEMEKPVSKKSSTEIYDGDSMGQYVATYNSGKKAYIIPGTLKVSPDGSDCDVKIVAVGDSGDVEYLSYHIWQDDDSLQFSNSQGFSGAVTPKMRVENKIWEIVQEKDTNDQYVATYNSGKKAYIVPGTLKVSHDGSECNVKIAAVGDSGDVEYLSYHIWQDDDSLQFSNSQGFSGAVTPKMRVENKIWEIVQEQY